MAPVKAFFLIDGYVDDIQHYLEYMTHKFDDFISITEMNRLDFNTFFNSPLDMPIGFDCGVNEMGNVLIRNAIDLVLLWYVCTDWKDIPITYCTDSFQVLTKYESWKDIKNVIEVEKLDGIDQALDIAKKLNLVTDLGWYVDDLHDDIESAIF